MREAHNERHGLIANDVVTAENIVAKLRETAHSQVKRSKERAMPTSIAREEVQRLIREGAAQLVEVVLPTQEYQDEHIGGAINIPLKRFNRETTSHLDKARPVIVY